MILLLSLAASIWLSSGPDCSPFGPERADVANRLFRSLFIRTASNGREFGCDENDPLFWNETRHLLEDRSHRRAIEALDAFLSRHGEREVEDPRKRALLQRALWALFDWSARQSNSFSESRRPLQGRLAPILRRLRLDREAILALPDNYAQAVASGTFATGYDPDHPERPFLPRDLFDPAGAWVCVTADDGPAAPTHLSTFSGRSAFLVFLTLPGGRQETLDYLERLRLERSAQFPPGTAVALVRQALVIEAQGMPVASPVTENVQLRVYRSIRSIRSIGSTRDSAAQIVQEVKLSWLELAAGKHGLRPVAPDEKEFPLFASHGIDLFERFSMFESGLRPVLRSCASCHSEPGIDSLRTRGWAPRFRTLRPTEPRWEREAAIHWKLRQYDWGLLEGLQRSNERR